MKMLAKIAGVTLKNTMLYNEQLLFHNNLRSILKAGIYLNTFKGCRELGRHAEIKLASLFMCEHAKVYFLDTTDLYIWRYEISGKKVSFKSDSGILGQSLMKKSIFVISNPTMEPSFNALVDIESHMPIVAVPIKCSITDRVLGAFEVINTRGIEGMSSTGIAKLSNKDYDILDFFSKQLAQCKIFLFLYREIFFRYSQPE
jgi:hypothetical protein